MATPCELCHGHGNHITCPLCALDYANLCRWRDEGAQGLPPEPARIEDLPEDDRVYPRVQEVDGVTQTFKIPDLMTHPVPVPMQGMPKPEEVERLERDCARLRELLASTEAQLRRTQDERDRLLAQAATIQRAAEDNAFDVDFDESGMCPSEMVLDMMAAAPRCVRARVRRDGSLFVDVRFLHAGGEVVIHCSTLIDLLERKHGDPLLLVMPEGTP